MLNHYNTLHVLNNKFDTSFIEIEFLFARFYKNIFYHQVIVNWKMMVIILPSQSVDGNVNTLHCMKKKICILWFLFSWKCPIMEYALHKEKQYKRIDSLRLKYFFLEFDHSYNLINLVLRKKIKTRSATTIIVWEQKSAMVSKYSLIVVPISQLLSFNYVSNVITNMSLSLQLH